MPMEQNNGTPDLEVATVIIFFLFSKLLTEGISWEECLIQESAETKPRQARVVMITGLSRPMPMEQNNGTPDLEAMTMIIFILFSKLVTEDIFSADLLI